MSLERNFDTTLIAGLARREKQIQQSYRPIIGIHKWFARRPGTLFRGLLLSEYVDEPLSTSFFKGHDLHQLVIADPFMGGGTPIIEANRLGMKVIGADINPMSYWTVRQSLASLDLEQFKAEAGRVVERVEARIAELYSTECVECGGEATVKYFLWVKQYPCRECGERTDLFPGYLIATDDRHTSFVHYCANCHQLAQVPERPTREKSVDCPHCRQPLKTQPEASRGTFHCRECHATNTYPDRDVVPGHRLFAMEYHCSHCRSEHQGRYFKVPDDQDLAGFVEAGDRLQQAPNTLIPDDVIPEGDETTRLRRWGYARWRDLFNERQLFGLQALLSEILRVEDRELRFALATVFSDMLRYQNMLCRYDTMALKCQDIFSVHGFPVGLIQCENNLLGIPKIGSGGFRHFVEKYVRAKEYCAAPFEIVQKGRTKKPVFTAGETISADFAHNGEMPVDARARLFATDSSSLAIAPNTLDGVFTDPPYFDNVQYAELMDFCFVWLRQALGEEVRSFRKSSTRDPGELTGNATLARGIDQFTEGLSAVYRRMVGGLKQGAPLAFTYHHNDPNAYLPLIVAILDSGLTCTAALACPAEMSASLHINGTGSSTVDTIFVCRTDVVDEQNNRPFIDCVSTDVELIKAAGVPVSQGDVVCMSLGHLTRIAIQQLHGTWDPTLATRLKMQRSQDALNALLDQHPPQQIAKVILKSA